MSVLGRLGPLAITSIAFLVSGILSALFGQPDFGLIMVAVSAGIAYFYQTAWQKGKIIPPGSTSHWQQGKFIAGQEVLHFGRQAQVVAVPVGIVPRNHVPVAYADENGCFATVPWSELQYPRRIRMN